MRKRQLIVGVILLFFGVPPLLNSLSNPRLAALHGVDIVRLMASGACFGVAVVALLGRLRLSDRKAVTDQAPSLGRSRPT